MTAHGAHPHRQSNRQPIPNWLKVFYVTMIFLAYVFALALTLKH